MSIQDEYELSSGLPLDGATVTITDMEFGYNAQIGAGVVCANITFANEDGEEIVQSFSVGDGWEITDKGGSIAADHGGPKKLSNRSNYGRLIESMVKTVGGAEHMPAPSPKSVEGFVGTSWTFGTVKVTTTNPTTQEKKEKDAFIVTKFLANGSKPAAKVSKAAKTTKLGGKKTLADVDPDLFATLVELAGNYESHTEFMEAALDLDEVDGNQLATTAIVGTKPGSVWAAKE